MVTAGGELSGQPSIKLWRGGGRRIVWYWHSIQGLYEIKLVSLASETGDMHLIFLRHLIHRLFFNIIILLP